MISRSLLVAGLTLAASMVPVSSGLAEDAASSSAAPPPAAAAAAQPAQNWLKVCAPVKPLAAKSPASASAEPAADASSSAPAADAAAPAATARACVMQQIVVTPNRQFLGSFLLREDPGQESRLLAVAAVPLSVLLPFGVTWQIDGNKPFRVPYMLCDPQSCATQLAVNEAFVNALKKGSKLTLTAKNRKNEDLIITFNLAGFTGVYDGEAALTFDEYNKQASGQASLEKILQDRAEAARQARSADGSASSSAPSSAPAQ